MFKTILFPTDFSDVSFKALDTLKTMHDGGVEKVILLHVVDLRLFFHMDDYAGVQEIQDQMQEHRTTQAKNDLEEMAGKLRDQGFTVIPKVVFGVPVREILNAEQEDGVELIVLGSHGRSNLAEIFLGSVAEKVMRKCSRPILMIKR